MLLIIRIISLVVSFIMYILLAGVATTALGNGYPGLFTISFLMSMFFVALGFRDIKYFLNLRKTQ